jgi:hypothetical protein
MNKKDMQRIINEMTGSTPTNPGRRAILPLVAGAAIAGSLGCSTPSLAQAPDSRLSAEDRLDILELFSRYAWSYDCSDVEGVINTFTEDAVIEAFGSEAARGHDGIRPFMAMLYDVERGDAIWQHLNDHHVFSGQGNQCQVYNYWTLVQTLDGETSVRSNGFYITDCVKVNNQWLMSRRNINRWDRSKTPWNNA